jgi:transposase-like protein
MFDIGHVTALHEMYRQLRIRTVTKTPLLSTNGGRYGEKIFLRVISTSLKMRSASARKACLLVILRPEHVCACLRCGASPLVSVGYFVKTSCGSPIRMEGCIAASARLAWLCAVCCQTRNLKIDNYACPAFPGNLLSVLRYLRNLHMRISYRMNVINSSSFEVAVFRRSYRSHNL